MNRKEKRKIKINFKLLIVLGILAIFAICFFYNIIALFINPTDTFMIENGKISSTEENTRIYN